MANKKLISWNVNGLRACMGKGFMEFFEQTDADIFCLQEITLQDHFLLLYYMCLSFFSAF